MISKRAKAVYETRNRKKYNCKLQQKEGDKKNLIVRLPV
jgi:hypothetical protein